MKTVSLLACLLLIGSPVLAQAATPQQQRMADCSAKNKGKTGEDYKSAQKACLSGPAPTATTPQERMKTCNADAAAKKLAGDARKTFMSGCLKAH
ncbi:PsiF family protein [Stenotrophomonas sp. 364]|uniref:PsiF family protein n=1 Tax=Stenotrophomonas sp. 364 TaxID=2691571 RepID=UPI001318312D|nr:PsiF family protein [Stenotrophomonas sp. 364]QHB71030.1 starvation-inducible protein [Stenotrophomonas sp. 364]